MGHHLVFEVHKLQRQEHDRSSGTGRDDRAHGTTQTRGNSIFDGRAALELTRDRLEDDDAVVDDQSDRERESEQRHEVQRLAGDEQEGKRREQRDRNRQPNDRNRPPLLQEEKEHDEGNDEARRTEPSEPPDLLFDLLGRGSIGHAGAFINLGSGHCAPIPLPVAA